jgi:hypothetical protein
VLLLACHSSPPAVDEGTPQRPPRGQIALEPWLAAGHHRSWACEAMISPPRLSGNHGRQLVCSNDLLVASTAGEYPGGAASVKELFDDADQPNGFAVGLKLDSGEGPQRWYWYERRGVDPTAPPKADGVGLPDCAVCHGTAPRDFVFVRPS